MQIENFDKLQELSEDYKTYSEVVKEYEKYLEIGEVGMIKIDLVAKEDIKVKVKSTLYLNGESEVTKFPKGKRIYTIGSKDKEMGEAMWKFMINFYKEKANKIKEEFESIKIK